MSTGGKRVMLAMMGSSTIISNENGKRRGQGKKIKKQAPLGKGTDSLYKRAKYTLAICILLMVVLCIFSYAINGYVSETGSKYIVVPDDVPRADVILILGAWVLPDGSLSDALGNRLESGYELYRKGKAEKFIVSGDHGRQDYDEVNAMKKYLADRNVPTENVFMDHAGFTTYESLYRARDIFQVKKIIIVTQQYHLMRAVYIARELGLEAYGVPSDYYYAHLITTRDHIREILARNKAFFFTRIIKPKPTFLGEAIPISGDGRITEDK